MEVFQNVPNRNEKSPITITARTEAAGTMVDITSLLEDAASALTNQCPMLCASSFNLQDSMAALEIMDRKMDCCEIPVCEIKGLPTTANEEDRMIFPRPAPTGLDDAVDPLPWNELTMEAAAFIATENLVRIESLLSGSSVVESIYTNLFAHKVVLEEMRERLYPSTVPEKLQSIIITHASSRKGTTSQHVVFATTLLMVEMTDLVRGVILNADIYEEEDFAVSTYNIPTLEGRDEHSVMEVGKNVLQMIEEELSISEQNVNQQDKNAVQLIMLILEFQLDFMSLVIILARLAGKTIRTEVEESQKLSRTAKKKLQHIVVTFQKLQANQSDSTSAAIRRSFDSYVNRPLVGNAPVRSIEFLDANASLEILIRIVGEFDWAVCETLLRADSLGRIRRMLRPVSISSSNVLTRSLLVLNLYFDDLIFGQYSLAELIVRDMKQLSHVPDRVFQYAGTLAFLNRLCKPVYDTLKVLSLNRNRQRSYLDIMMGDWAALREEAYIADVTNHQESGSSMDIQPHFSLYVLYFTIGLMDHYVDLSVELQLCCSEHELAVAYWYRDFLTSSRLTQLNTMRCSKHAVKQSEQMEVHPLPSTKSQKSGKKKGKSKRHSSNGNDVSSNTSSPEDLEDDFEFLLLNIERGLCRGLVRFFAALKQAGLVKEEKYEFTSNRHIFAKRFEPFLCIIQPPPLSYDDYLKGSDFSKVSQQDLIASTSECFSVSKSMIEKLLAQIPLIDPIYLPATEDELRQLVKICVGNTIYLHKLKQVVEGARGKVTNCVSIDVETNKRFCIVKIA
jgi:hypothetical protein